MYVPCVSELDLTYRWPWVSVGDRVNVFNLRQNETAWARYDLRQFALASGHLMCPGHRLLAWAALPRLQTVRARVVCVVGLSPPSPSPPKSPNVLRSRVVVGPVPAASRACASVFTIFTIFTTVTKITYNDATRAC